MKSDVHERITSKIVSDLEQGVRPSLKPWNAGGGRSTCRKRDKAATISGDPALGLAIVLSLTAPLALIQYRLGGRRSLRSAR